MAQYKVVFDTQRSPTEVFGLLSDFSRSEEWDPGVVRAKRVDAGRIGEGSAFELVTRFLGRDTELTYRIVEYARPRLLTLHAESATVVSHDSIAIAPATGGARVTYDARLHLKGPLRFADPLLAVAFRRIGDRALAGLKHALAQPL